MLQLHVCPSSAYDSAAAVYVGAAAAYLGDAAAMWVLQLSILVSIWVLQLPL